MAKAKSSKATAKGIGHAKAGATEAQWGSYSRAYDYFNRALFSGELPSCILNFSRKSARTLGFFAPQRWESAEDADTKAHEISLNPDTLAQRGRRDVASTLVHEMVHLWRAEQPGKQPRGGYHCKKWGEKMEEVGLMPSATGAPGGRKTGQQMTHYIIDGGPFARAFDSLPADCLLPFVSNPALKPAAKKRNKTKYVCPKCDANVWGKPDLSIMCCNEDEHDDGEPCYFEAEEE